MPESLKDEIRDLELTVRELRLGLEEMHAEKKAAASSNPGGSTRELSPLVLTIFGGIVTGIFAIANSYFQAQQAHQLEEDKLKQSHQLEEDKLRFTLIMKAIEPADPAERKKALVFYVETGLLKDLDGKLANIKPQDIPQASESIEADFSDGATYTHVGGAALIQSGFTIDVNGAPHAYHPDGHSGLDYTVNAGGPGNWFGVVTNEAGSPVIQGPSDPAPGFYICPTSLQDVSRSLTDPRRYVDAETTPYIGLPVRVMKKIGEPKLGDLAAVLDKNNGKLSYAIVADGGPPRQLGEGSLALAIRLGLPSNPRKSGVPCCGIATLVFPGSGDGRPKTLEEIEAQGRKLFEAWGGLQRLQLEAQKAPPRAATPPTPSSEVEPGR